MGEESPIMQTAASGPQAPYAEQGPAVFILSLSRSLPRADCDLEHSH